RMAAVRRKPPPLPTAPWKRSFMFFSDNTVRAAALSTAAMTIAAVALASIALCKDRAPIETLAGDKKGVHPMTTAVVELPIEGQMPELSGATGWLNSKPFTAADLRGKVVLVDFWTYSCINWLRQLPYVRAWADKYKDQGLLVIGVHSPEFSFE